MTRTLVAVVLDQVKADEGLRLFPYEDTTGHLTIGYGHNLTAKGLRSTFCEQLLVADLQDAVAELETALSWVDQLDMVRQGVLLQLAFNLGIKGLLGFHQMLTHLQAGEWDAAAAALIDSTAGHQEPARIQRWANQLAAGQQLA